ncbi:hypothetical protein EVAR_42504_1 [Eumeta japonica]|uniref:Uncharacterized protein n=1 Tax=Eumeta variegata TaxID=151549 RepID=A0A4C1XIU5_EUMVA|nr:hypothetical protein EVAR_42504_1 [Eumeta japonica]
MIFTLTSVHGTICDPDFNSDPIAAQDSSPNPDAYRGFVLDFKQRHLHAREDTVRLFHSSKESFDDFSRVSFPFGILLLLLPQAEDAVCLADFCDIMRCGVLVAHGVLNGGGAPSTDVEVWQDVAAARRASPAPRRCAAATPAPLARTRHRRRSITPFPDCPSTHDPEETGKVAIIDRLLRFHKIPKGKFVRRFENSSKKIDSKYTSLLWTKGYRMRLPVK